MRVDENKKIIPVALKQSFFFGLHVESIKTFEEGSPYNGDKITILGELGCVIGL